MAVGDWEGSPRGGADQIAAFAHRLRHELR
jgi:hypothetical protein